MKMSTRFISLIILFSLLVWVPSCKVKKKYIEQSELRSDEKPSEIAKKIAKQQKKQQRQYDRLIKKRHRKKARTGRLGNE